MCVGLMLFPVIVPELAENPGSNPAPLLIPISIVIGSFIIIGLNHKKSADKFKQAELDEEGIQFIKTRRKRGYSLLAISIFSWIIFGIGMSILPDFTGQSAFIDRMSLGIILIIALLAGVFTFLGYIGVAASKLSKWREYYERTPSGVQEKRDYIVKLKTQIQKHKEKPPNKLNTFLFIVAFILIAIGAVILFITRDHVFFHTTEYGPYSIAIFILLVMGMLLALLQLSFTIPGASKIYDALPNFSKNKKRVLIFILAFIIIGVFAIWNVAIISNKEPLSDSDVYIVNEQTVYPSPTFQVFNYTIPSDEIDDMEVYIKGRATADCNVIAEINYTVIFYFNGQSQDNQSWDAYDTGIGECPSEESVATVSWRFSGFSVEYIDNLSIALDMHPNPTNNEEVITITIIKMNDETRFFLGENNNLWHFGPVVFCSVVYLLFSTISLPLHWNDDVKKKKEEESKGIGDLAPDLERATTFGQEPSLPAPEPEISPISSLEPEQEMVEQEGEFDVSQNFPHEYMEDRKTRFTYITILILMVITIITPALILAGAFAGSLLTMGLSLASIIIFSVGLTMAIGLVEKVYPRGAKPGYVLLKVNIKRVKKITRLLLIVIICCSVISLGFWGLFASIRKSEYLVDDKIFESSPVNQEYLITAPRTSDDRIFFIVSGTAKAECQDVAVINVSYSIRINGDLKVNTTKTNYDQGVCSSDPDEYEDSKASFSMDYLLESLEINDTINFSIIFHPGALNTNESVSITAYYQNAKTEMMNEGEMFIFMSTIIPLALSCIVLVINFLTKSIYKDRMKRKNISPEDKEILRLMFGRRKE
ncbi:MAG: hypothetical protein ACFFCS_19355, partial [Candidatus Hodarchaeota archaeon]